MEGVQLIGGAEESVRMLKLISLELQESEWTEEREMERQGEGG